jgi:protein O-GlcNAc transferase
MTQNEKKKVISFSLWGDNPKYTVGAIRNAEIAQSVYPDWVCRFYCDEKSVPAEKIDTVMSMPNVEVIRLSASKEPHWSMFWRFYAAADPCVDVAVFRDSDSRVGIREALAVENWLASGKTFHVMRDHRHHNSPICGGMWGVRGSKLRNMRLLIDSYYRTKMDRSSLYGIDQDFLIHSVCPMMNGDCIEHDEFFARKPFPIARDPKHFVGQVYDENDTPLVNH